jgi:hypothetical protein
MAGFLTHWKLTYAPRNSAIWDELGEALALGVGYDEKQQAFFAPCVRMATPYAEKILQENIPPKDRAIVTGVMVNARAQPNTSGEVVEQLSHEIVKLAGEPDPDSRQTIAGQTHPWWPIALYNGKKAYVWGKYLRSWNAYEARFEKVGDAWKLVRLAPRQD